MFRLTGQVLDHLGQRHKMSLMKVWGEKVMHLD